MFSIEIKVNGRLLSCITGHRLKDISEENDYTYECYTYKKDVVKGFVKHKHKEGIHKLVKNILTQVIRRM